MTAPGATSTPCTPAGSSGTVVDLDETYAWGLEELARIEHRMARGRPRVAPQAPGGDDADAVQRAIAAGIDALDADPGRTDRQARGSSATGCRSSRTGR